MTDLASWLLQQIAEDEQVANAALNRSGADWGTEPILDGARVFGTAEYGSHPRMDADGELWDDEGALGMWPETAAHVAAWDPTRVLAECKFKRRIIRAHNKWCDGTCESPDGPSDAYPYHQAHYWSVRVLSLPYADRPGYRDEWRP